MDGVGALVGVRDVAGEPHAASQASKTSDRITVFVIGKFWSLCALMDMTVW